MHACGAIRTCMDTKVGQRDRAHPMIDRGGLDVESPRLLRPFFCPVPSVTFRREHEGRLTPSDLIGIHIVRKRTTLRLS